MDIRNAVTMLSRYNMCPREGHLIAMTRLFGYLKGHSKGQILFDTHALPIGEVKFFDGGNWFQTYRNVKEELPPDLPTAKMKPVKIIIYFDASFACNMITRR